MNLWDTIFGSNWTDSKALHIFIFNVGRGLSVFIRTSSNHGILYDLGSSADFSPLNFLEKHILPHLEKYEGHRIAQMIISHPHGDHITEIESVKEAGSNGSVYPYFLTCPHDRDGAAKPEKIDWNRITNRDSESALLDCYRTFMEGRNPPLQSLLQTSDLEVDGLEYGIYYVRPPYIGSQLHPTSDQEYSNGISLMLYLKYGAHSILLPGDANPAAIKHILDEGVGMEKRYTRFGAWEMLGKDKWTKENANQPSLKALLNVHGLSVLLAPHHGLESGYSEELYAALKDGKPRLAVVSEKRHTGENDGAVDSRYHGTTGASGLTVNIDGKDEVRNSVSTRNDHHILIKFESDADSPVVVLRSNPEELIAEM